MSKKSDKYPVIIEKAMLLKFSKDFKFVGYEDKEYEKWNNYLNVSEQLYKFLDDFDTFIYHLNGLMYFAHL